MSARKQQTVREDEGSKPSETQGITGQRFCHFACYQNTTALGFCQEFLGMNGLGKTM